MTNNTNNNVILQGDVTVVVKDNNGRTTTVTFVNGKLTQITVDHAFRDMIGVIIADGSSKFELVGGDYINHYGLITLQLPS